MKSKKHQIVTVHAPMLVHVYGDLTPRQAYKKVHDNVLQVLLDLENKKFAVNKLGNPELRIDGTLCEVDRYAAFDGGECRVSKEVQIFDDKQMASTFVKVK